MEEQGDGNNGPEEALEEEDITREEHLPGEAFSLVVTGVILGTVEVVVADVEGEMVEVAVGEMVEVEDDEVGVGRKEYWKKMSYTKCKFKFPSNMCV